MRKTLRTDTLRLDQIRDFREEFRRLEEKSVLTLSAEQRQAIARHYDALLAGNVGGTKRPSIEIRIASFIAALGLAAIVFFLFNPYWLLFPTSLQVALLIAATVSTLLVTFWLARHETIRGFAGVAALFAFACFVVNLLLLGRMFNVSFTPTPLIPWAAYAVLLAYTFKSKLLLALGALCAITFVVAGVGTWGGYW